MKKILIALCILVMSVSVASAQRASVKEAAKEVAPPAAAKEVAKDAPQAATAPMKKAKKAATAMATGMPKMTHKCPKGCALADAGGKCPKCSTDMVAIAPKAVKRKKAAAKAPAVEEKKG